MNIASPLFALDIGDCASVIVPLVFGVIWLLNQIIKNANKAQPPAAKPGAAPRRPAAAVDQEIEAFLRRAAQAKGGQPAMPPVQQPARPRPAAQPRAATAQRPQPTAQRSQPTAPRSPARTAAPPPLPPQAARPAVRKLTRTDEETLGNESIDEHVKRHIDSSDVSERADHLVKVDQAVAGIDRHVHQALDHQVGHLATSSDSANISSASSATLSPASTAAAGLGLLLANPVQLRNAFILQEIFQRPSEDRWERT